MNEIIQVDTPVLMDMTPKWMPATGVPREVGEVHDVMGNCGVCGLGPGRCEGTLTSDGRDRCGGCWSAPCACRSTG